MQRASWILRALASSVLLAGTACACAARRPPESPEPAEVCTPMSSADWARTRTQARIDDQPEARRKLDILLVALLQNVERVNAGQPASRHPNIPGVPLRCIPAEVPVMVVHRGTDMQPLFDAGLRAPGQHPRDDLDMNIAIGVVSRARLMDLARVPSVVGIHAPSRMGLERRR